LLVGASVFRKIAFTNTFAGIPEIFIAYDMQSITWYSAALDTKAGISPGYGTHYDHEPRLLFRANMSFGDKTLFTLCPYLGYEYGFAIGLNVGAIF